ncbi:hypothetical protein MAR_022095 [Mya arenaria]|uniref:Uncharacterized protein n=1 Tax=Mya arenaria TaxID=6604 RepID=A0ABY7DJ42_MYAAR|nr:hypothetical protein MAR_022095 [Mya arenaria]
MSQYGIGMYKKRNVPITHANVSRENAIELCDFAIHLNDETAFPHSDSLEDIFLNTMTFGKNNLKMIWNLQEKVSVMLNRVAEKDYCLIGNSTTNISKCWMAIHAKLDGGRQINRCQRSSWNTRCCWGALRFFVGPAWSPMVFQEVMWCEADTKKNRFMQAIKTIREVSQSNANEEITFNENKCIKKANLDCGQPFDDTPDTSATEIE